MPKYLYHNKGPSPCFKKAMEYLPEDGPVAGQDVCASEWRGLSGEPFKGGDRIMCGSCGSEMLGMLNIEDVHE